jgi:acyl-ACP thioesterase
MTMNISEDYLFEHLKTVQHFHAGPTGLATMSALCRFAQESAGCHAEALGFGSMKLARRNIAWVLREQAMDVRRFPALGEPLRVRTWPTRAERILCHRDFAVLDGQGHVVALGTSAWFGVDLATRRPCKAESFFSLPWHLLPAPAFEEPLPGLEAPEGDGLCEVRTARASDIDALGHMNNLRYVDWIADHLAGAGGGTGSLRRLRIRYAREVVAGERIVIRHDRNGDGDVRVVMTGEDHGREVCLARVTVEPAADGGLSGC